MKGEYTFYNDTFEFDECLLHNMNKTLNTCSILNDFNDIVNTYVGQILKKNAQYIFYLHIFIYLIDREKGRAVHIFSIFYTHH
jgi:hypothetical protein